MVHIKIDIEHVEQLQVFFIKLTLNFQRFLVGEVPLPHREVLQQVQPNVDFLLKPHHAENTTVSNASGTVGQRTNAFVRKPKAKSR